MITKDDIKDEYFEWMCDLVFCNGRKKSYRKLLTQFHLTDFSYSLPMDGNRAEDGIDFRYRYGYDKGIDQAIIATYLDDRPCSLLEMMTALANRCEETIMGNGELGNRTAVWFLLMLKNLHLDGMTDNRFDKTYVINRIKEFLNRDYQSNGDGGLFIVENQRDLRDVDIWLQMGWYMTSIMKN